MFLQCRGSEPPACVRMRAAAAPVHLRHHPHHPLFFCMWNRASWLSSRLAGGSLIWRPLPDPMTSPKADGVRFLSASRPAAVTSERRSSWPGSGGSAGPERQETVSQHLAPVSVAPSFIKHWNESRKIEEMWRYLTVFKYGNCPTNTQEGQPVWMLIR